MSLEQQIAVLANEAAALNQTFQNKKAEIDAAVAAAVAAAPSLYRTYYVDAVNGDDANEGTQAAPFATVKKACGAVPAGGFGRILLTDGQTHVIDQSIVLLNKRIKLEGMNGSGAAASATLTSTCTVKQSVSGNVNVMRSFYLVGGSLELAYVDVDLPARADPTLIWGWNSGLVTSGEADSIIPVKMRWGDLFLRDGNCLINCDGSTAMLGLLRVDISTPVATDVAYVVSKLDRGTAVISTTGVVTLSGGAKMVDVLRTNPDGLSNVITNYGATVL